MALTVLFEGTVAKHVESPDDNEDARCLAPERGRVVLSDGASESFDARNWARLLVERILEEELSMDTVAVCARSYEAIYDPDTLSWSKAAAYERGSFATLLIAQDLPDANTVQITAVGDSLAVWLDGDQWMASAPYERSDQFQEKPSLLATRLELNESDDEHWSVREWKYEAQGDRFLLCMTDALGAWLLAHQERGDSSALKLLSGIRYVQELTELVERERSAGRMRRDDSTLIIASVTQS
ncbi:hypothetical protein [Stenotrophomonas sp. 24(2023)]|uniref:hypothetical protein n=1 Tax=Stenotrophomonas sp. 24(2023) TaxID=3068324 RepID=UPI0027DF2030|nr:hypothetical protein [Stenotrophomonas sp. 24(2023)]WMJ70640.1 hypothetical protein Q9R17_05940 [Stenotrophomonas sp. 24(2023)]